MKQYCVGFILIVITPILLFSKDYNILSFGAVSGGKKINTAAIQAAINKAYEDGGGRVVIPAGNFLSGSIVLKSGIELHLLEEAVLLGSINQEDYIKINRWKGLVMADAANHISISGKGVLDGQGAQLALSIDSLFYVGLLDSIHYIFPEMRPRAYLRPQIIEFVNCKNVKVTGVTLKNASCWVQTYDKCQNLIIDSIKVESDAYWNNDGIDISDCRNVRITNCFVNSSDDGICLKSHSRNGAAFCDSIYIANCTVRSSASAIKIGTASYTGFKNIVIENIKVYDTFRSAIAIESINGGFLENVVVNNINAVNTGNAIFIRLGKMSEKRPVSTLKNIVIKNVRVEVPFERMDDDYEIRGPELPFFHNVFPSSITGIPGQPVENVTLENIEIIYPGRGNKAYAYMPLSRLNEVPEAESLYPEFSMFGELPSWGFYIRHVEGLSMKNVKVEIKNPDYRPAYVFDDVKKLNIQSLDIVGDHKSKSIIYNNVPEVNFKE